MKKGKITVLKKTGKAIAPGGHPNKNSHAAELNKNRKTKIEMC